MKTNSNKAKHHRRKIQHIVSYERLIGTSNSTGVMFRSGPGGVYDRLYGSVHVLAHISMYK